jgi:hypothetical protein
MELEGVLQGLLQGDDNESKLFRAQFGKKDSLDRERLIFIVKKLSDVVKFLHALLSPCSSAISYMEGAEARVAFCVPIAMAMEADLKVWFDKVRKAEYAGNWYEYPTTYFKAKADDVDGREKTKKWTPNYTGWEETEGLFESKESLISTLDIAMKRRMVSKKSKTESAAFTPFLNDVHHVAFWAFDLVCVIQTIAGTKVTHKPDAAMKGAELLKMSQRSCSDNVSATACIQGDAEPFLGDLTAHERRDVMLEGATEIAAWSAQSALVRSYTDEMVDIRKAKPNMTNVEFIQIQLKKALPIVKTFWNNQYPHLQSFSPVLQRSALCALSWIASSASVERANSCMKSVHTKGRLRLGHAKALQLTKLRFNNAANLYKRKDRNERKRATRERRERNASAMNGEEEPVHASDVLCLDQANDDLDSDIDDELRDVGYGGHSDAEDDSGANKRQRRTGTSADDDDDFNSWLIAEQDDV